MNTTIKKHAFSMLIAALILPAGYIILISILKRDAVMHKPYEQPEMFLNSAGLPSCYSFFGM